MSKAKNPTKRVWIPKYILTLIESELDKENPSNTKLVKHMTELAQTVGCWQPEWASSIQAEWWVVFPVWDSVKGKSKATIEANAQKLCRELITTLVNSKAYVIQSGTETA